MALVVFGPKKLPEVGKQLGQALREFRKMADEVTGATHSIRDEVESVYKPVFTPPADQPTRPAVRRSNAPSRIGRSIRSRNTTLWLRLSRPLSTTELRRCRRSIGGRSPRERK